MATADTHNGPLSAVRIGGISRISVASAYDDPMVTVVVVTYDAPLLRDILPPERAVALANAKMTMPATPRATTAVTVLPSDPADARDVPFMFPLLSPAPSRETGFRPDWRENPLCRSSNA